MPKKATARKTAKRSARHFRSSGWFFARRAPDLPYWIFLCLAGAALVLFALWLKKPVIAPLLSSLPSPPSPTTSGEPKLLRRVTLESAANPFVVTQDNKVYLTFSNNTGGYSVAVYDDDLNQLEAPRWITNGQVVPNQQVAQPEFINENWYLAYLGCDGFTRLAKFDSNFNPQRTITFRTPLNSLKNPAINIYVPGTNHIVVTTWDATAGASFDATFDLGIRGERALASIGSTSTENFCLTKNNTIGSKTYQVEESGNLQSGTLEVGAAPTVTLKLFQNSANP